MWHTLMDRYTTHPHKNKNKNKNKYKNKKEPLCVSPCFRMLTGIELFLSLFWPLRDSRPSAPEIIRGEKYSESADVYSFGIVMWEVRLTTARAIVCVCLSSIVTVTQHKKRQEGKPHTYRCTVCVCACMVCVGFRY